MPVKAMTHPVAAVLLVSVDFEFTPIEIRRGPKIHRRERLSVSTDVAGPRVARLLIGGLIVPRRSTAEQNPEIAELGRSGWARVRDTPIVPTAELTRITPSFADGLPLTRAALEFAAERHAGQLRGDDRAPFVQHPLEVASLLKLAGYGDSVVASGVLHDVLENTSTDRIELEERFGSSVAALVQAVSEDASINDERDRKSALRVQVARSAVEAAAVFAADKVSKVRELRSQMSCGLPKEEADPKLNHYSASLSMLDRRLGRRHVLVEQLRFELEMLCMPRSL